MQLGIICSGWSLEVVLLMAFMVLNSLSSSSVSTELSEIRHDVKGAWEVML